MGRWVLSGSSYSLVRALGVVRFIGGRWVHSRGGWVNPVSLGSITRTLGVVGFIRGLWDYSRRLRELSGSSGVVGFTCVRHGIIWFIKDSCVGSCTPWGSLCSSRFVWFTFHAVGGLIRVSLSLSGVVGLTGVRHGCRWVYRE